MQFPCLSPEQGCPAGKECPIYLAGFCHLFGKIITRELNKKRSKYSFLENASLKEDFLAEVVEALIKALPSLRIKNEKGFTRFVRSIFHNVAVDFSKKEKKYKQQEEIFSNLVRAEADEREERRYIESLASYKPHEEEEILQRTQELLERLRQQDHPCAELVIYWYEKLCEGWNLKEMAESMGLKPNTFNQKLKRCFKFLR